MKNILEKFYVSSKLIKNCLNTKIKVFFHWPLKQRNIAIWYIFIYWKQQGLKYSAKKEFKFKHKQLWHQLNKFCLSITNKTASGHVLSQTVISHRAVALVFPIKMFPFPICWYNRETTVWPEQHHSLPLLLET